MQNNFDVKKVTYVIFVYMAATTRQVKKGNKSQFVLTIVNNLKPTEIG